jgi:hypothetical protein
MAHAIDYITRRGQDVKFSSSACECCTFSIERMILICVAVCLGEFPECRQSTASRPNDLRHVPHIRTYRLKLLVMPHFGNYRTRAPIVLESILTQTTVRDAQGYRQKTTSSSVRYRYISRLTETPVTTAHCTAYACRERIEGVPSGSVFK